MKVSKTLLSIIILVFILAACSSNSNATVDGVKSMQDTLVEMNKNMDTNDTVKVKEDAEKLEESWKKFEDGIKENQPDMYEKVEGPLGIIQAGAKQDTLDQALLKDQITKLNDTLKQIK